MPIGSTVCVNPDRDTNQKTKKRKLEFAFKDTAKVIRHCANNRTVEVEYLDGKKGKLERNRLKVLQRGHHQSDGEEDSEVEAGGAKAGKGEISGEDEVSDNETGRDETGEDEAGGKVGEDDVGESEGGDDVAHEGELSDDEACEGELGDDEVSSLISEDDDKSRKKKMAPSLRFIFDPHSASASGVKSLSQCQSLHWENVTFN